MKIMKWEKADWDSKWILGRTGVLRVARFCVSLPPRSAARSSRDRQTCASARSSEQNDIMFYKAPKKNERNKHVQSELNGKDNNGVSEKLRWLAAGPSMAVPSYRSYLINGV
ncbi:hypothetical protein L3X38_003559 [Prunus dulcis]|uniref:Uncharacterized protein n=1 Tax=Prunus dulcis TaxID=3755 RepID=A0AAD4ZM95_PRUDU|nr:hypothetical protein L3X38_003559 [Prunus dulcis]